MPAPGQSLGKAERSGGPHRVTEPVLIFSLRLASALTMRAAGGAAVN